MNTDSSVAIRQEIEKKVNQALEIQSQFISMVSHEMRTPLTALRESIALLGEMIRTKLTPEEAKILELARKNVERLVRFSQEVLDLSRLESGRLTLNKQTTNIAELIDHAVDTMKPLAKKKALHIDVNNEGTLPPVNADQDKISQVLLNLLNNSIKFTPLGGKITITARQPSKHYIAVSIKDNGLGIPKEHQDRVFEPFVHLAQPGNDMPGVGLGLSISKRLIDLHGGRVCFESQGKNKGCCFTFELPIS